MSYIPISSNTYKKFSPEEKRDYAIQMSKMRTKRVAMCIAEDKGMGVKHFRSFTEKLDEHKKPLYPSQLTLKKCIQEDNIETSYIKQLKRIAEKYPTYKQCSTGLSSIVRNAIVVDVDDDYSIAEERLNNIIKISNGLFPEPNYRIINNKTNHIQYMFILRDMIKYETNEEQLDYRFVTRMMNAVIGGDLNFRFYQCKNPYSKNENIYTKFNLPETIEGFHKFSDFLKTAEWIATLGTDILEEEIVKLIKEALQRSESKALTIKCKDNNQVITVYKKKRNLQGEEEYIVKPDGYDNVGIAYFNEHTLNTLDKLYTYLDEINFFKYWILHPDTEYHISNFRLNPKLDTQSKINILKHKLREIFRETIKFLYTSNCGVNVLNIALEKNQNEKNQSRNEQNIRTIKTLRCLRKYLKKMMNTPQDKSKEIESSTKDKEPQIILKNVSKNIDKVLRNEKLKNSKSITTNSRNILAMEYARRFTWECMSKHIEINVNTLISYLSKKSPEISQKVDKTELLSQQEIISTANCTLSWCIANYNPKKAKLGSYSIKQRQNSIYSRQEISFYRAKKAKKLREKYGYTISKISEILNLSEKTVGKYLNDEEYNRIIKNHYNYLKINKTFRNSQFLKERINNYLSQIISNKRKNNRNNNIKEIKIYNKYIIKNIFKINLKIYLKLKYINDSKVCVLLKYIYNNKLPIIKLGRAYIVTAPT